MRCGRKINHLPHVSSGPSIPHRGQDPSSWEPQLPAHRFTCRLLPGQAKSLQVASAARGSPVGGKEVVPQNSSLQPGFSSISSMSCSLDHWGRVFKNFLWNGHSAPRGESRASPGLSWGHLYSCLQCLNPQLDPATGQETFHSNLLCVYFGWVFVAAHGLLSCCAGQGLLSSYSAPASHCSAFSCCRAWTLGVGSRHVVLVAPHQVGSSWTRDQTHVPWRRIFNHWTNRKSPKASFWIQGHLEIIQEQFTYISGK